jgi:hypothetical protein
MAITISTLRSDAQSLSIKVGDADVTIVYRPSGMTPALIDEISSADGMSLPDFLTRLLVSWDVTDDAGVAWPTTPSALAELPVAFLRLVRNAIMEDLRGPKAPSAS